MRLRQRPYLLILSLVFWWGLTRASVVGAHFSDLIANAASINAGYLRLTPTLFLNGETGNLITGDATASTAVTLPAPYRPAEYVTFAGATYLDTGIDQLGDITVTADFQYDDVATIGQVLFGAQVSTANNCFYFSINNTSQRFSFSYGTAGTTHPKPIPADTNRHTLVVDNNYWYFDHAFLYANTIATKPNTAREIYLGTLNNNNAPHPSGFRGKLYGFTIAKEGVTRLDLIPVYNENTQAFGLYDLITQTLMPINGDQLQGALPSPPTLNREQDQGEVETTIQPQQIYDFSYTLANTGQTTYQNYLGDRISAWLESDFAPVEYIGFTGAQYLNTGIEHTGGNLTITADYLCSGNSNWIFGAGNTSAFTQALAIGQATPTTMAIRYGAIGNTAASGTNNTRHQLTFTGEPTKGTLKIDDAVPTVVTSNAPTMAVPIYLGQYNQNTTTLPTNGFQGRIYNFTIVREGISAISLLPAKNLHTGECGFFDQVSGRFLLSMTDSPFTCGPPLTPNSPLKVLLYPATTTNSNITTEVAAMQAGATLAPSAIATINGQTCINEFDGIAPVCQTDQRPNTLGVVTTIGNNQHYPYKFVVYAPQPFSSIYNHTKIYFGVSSGAQGQVATNWKQQIYPFTHATLLVDDSPVIKETTGANKFPFIGQAAENTSAYFQSLIVAHDVQDGPCTFETEACHLTLTSDGGFDPQVVGTYALAYQAVDSRGNTTTHTLEVSVVKIVHVATGMLSSMALDSAGRMFVFGENPLYTLGNNSTAVVTAPTLNSFNPTQFRAVDLVYEHGLGIGFDGSLWTWGENVYGKLGYTQAGHQPIPKQVTGLEGDPVFVKVSGYYDTSMALDSAGNLWVMGMGSYATGMGHTNNITTPTKVPSFGGGPAVITDFATGYTGDSTPTVLAVDASGNVWAWGYGDYGSGGTGDDLDQLAPTKIYEAATGNFLKMTGAVNPLAITLPPGTMMTKVSVGEGAGFALDSEGNIYGWGSDIENDLGDGQPGGANHSPQKIYDATTGNFLLKNGSPNPQADSPKMAVKMTSLTTNYASTFTLDEEGNLYAWGNGDGGKLGTGVSADSPHPRRIYQAATGEFIGSATFTATLPAGTKIIQVSADADGYALLLAENGAVFATGTGTAAKLGLANTSDLIVRPWIFTPPPIINL